MSESFAASGKCRTDIFPTIGNFFSNHWKKREKFFQSLENSGNFFPIVGKTGGIFQPLEKSFPIIGKFSGVADGGHRGKKGPPGRVGGDAGVAGPGRGEREPAERRARRGGEGFRLADQKEKVAFPPA
jgi:hypothetical protein